MISQEEMWGNLSIKMTIGKFLGDG
ncbi:hypothetical protein XAC3562_630002 [Xanthomonas citri pv. citri]|uniref:Uncharacterized protein n=1 Tax=Xanthomonas citri pv. citri TaxID=611301 RepID=A0A0U5FIB7_XANCI|nr:hypothetical protein XAC3562_630002 [Xanthomonas citri pv. citri]CEH74072.1 hypothetical protein XAC3612_1860002 [Xanthomonas citri pv. citri]CEH74099.1 hypothetical protein XACLD7_9420002 [Xanthomonas citri pv. citri]CEH74152.1 hypothetical protein XACLH37_1890002 [Xanthomonas citri pv. citri]CEI12084.1 hypothetical protein XACLG98_1950002 [Xanthomonas citri pv. citri]